MKRLLTTIAVLLLAVPAFAQDDLVLTGADIDALLGGGGGGRGGNRGNQQNRGNNLVPDSVAMFTQLKDLLKTKKVPLDKNQEKPLQALLDAEAKAIQTDLEAQFNRGGNNNQNRGGNNNQQNFPNQQNFQLPEMPNRPQCVQRDATTQQRLAPLADLLTKGKKPLTAEQQTKFLPMIEAAMPKMRAEMLTAGVPQQQIDNIFNQANPQRGNNQNNNTGQVNPQQLTNNIVNTIMSQLGIQNNNNNNQNNQNRGGRGGEFNQNNQNQNNQNPQNAGNNNQNQGNRGFNPQQEAQKRSDALLDRVIASLKPDQQPFVKKFKYDLIKQRGGAEKIRAIVEEEGTPLAPEQITQIQALFNAEAQAVRNYATQLVQTEVQALPPSALQPPPQTQQQQNQQNQQQGNRNNNNQNNPTQNPVAGQIVAKVLPEVSKRRALLERTTLDSIMRVLTPAQVASYKLSNL